MSSRTSAASRFHLTSAGLSRSSSSSSSSSNDNDSDAASTATSASTTSAADPLVATASPESSETPPQQIRRRGGGGVGWWAVNEDEYSKSPLMFWLTYELWDQYNVFCLFVVAYYEFLAAFLFVFVSTMMGVIVVNNMEAHEIQLGTALIPTPTATSLQLDVKNNNNNNSSASATLLSYYFGLAPDSALLVSNRNVPVVFAAAATSASVILFIALALPGITAHPVLATGQWIAELFAEAMTYGNRSSGSASSNGNSGAAASRAAGRRDGNNQRCCLCKSASERALAYIFYTVKLLSALAAQRLGGFTASEFVSFVVASSQFRAYFDYVDSHSSGSARTVMLEFVFFFFFAWTYESFYRVSPQGRRPYYSTSSYYSIPLAAVMLSLAHFIGVFVMFSVTGSNLNFLVFLSLASSHMRHSTGMAWFAIGEFTSGVLAVILSHALYHVPVLARQLRANGIISSANNRKQTADAKSTN